MLRLAFASLISFACLAGCDVFASELQCSRDSECVRQGFVGGSCQAGGCAFPDSSCPSFLRYDSTAPGRGDQCVPEDPGFDSGPGMDYGAGLNACGGDTVLEGDPGTPCGNCNMGAWACDGMFSVVCAGEPTRAVPITMNGLADASSCFDAATCADADPDYRPVRAMDGNIGTSWFSGPPKTDMSPTRFDWLGVADECIAGVRVIGNGAHEIPTFQTNYGFGRVEIQVLDRMNEMVGSGEAQNLPGTPDPDAIASPMVAGRTVRLLFTGHEDATGSGFSEIIVTALRP